jgi:hypothetical protein
VFDTHVERDRAARLIAVVQVEAVLAWDDIGFRPRGHEQDQSRGSGCYKR